MISRFRLLALLAVFAITSAQIGSAVAEPAEPDSNDASGFKVAPLPIIFYTPETQTAVGAALNVFYRAEGATKESRPSTLTPLFIYTFNNQVITLLGGNHYWDDERNNLEFGVSYINFPDSFYGIGNDVSSDDPEDYTSETSGLGFNYLRRVRESLRAGFGADYGRSNILEREDGGILDGGDILGSEGGAVVSVGLTLDYDDRDDITYARTGGWSRIDFRFFDETLGSDFDFRLTSLESRRYFSFERANTLALRGLITHADGSPPFQLLPSLGGDSLLRGYFGGRFRERDRMVLEAEFRRALWNRLGAVLFGGVGQVAYDPADYRIDAFHAAAGFGLRFLFIRSEELNIRIDFGFGEDDSGTYISLGEAY